MTLTNTNTPQLLRDLPLHTVPVVEPSAFLADVIAALHDEPLGIVVLVGDGQYMGVYTEGDENAGRVPANAPLDELAVGPYASGLRFVGAPNMPVSEARALMVRHNLRAMPVVANRIYKGVVAIEDVGE